ncbi:hypothetical protein BLNAU_6658 [Blattamonas nauphoetae]|uniref:Uncharacterized protein n=1 Tax=Blattamonas nauphoetae TaxID=2049346 RepID=A0ABQ9Y3W3_9EUKA|nr:hypothetical protein BLNAU_6658 [Blattamonas nauphoetae]
MKLPTAVFTWLTKCGLPVVDDGPGPTPDTTSLSAMTTLNLQNGTFIYQLFQFLSKNPNYSHLGSILTNLNIVKSQSRLAIQNNFKLLTKLFAVFKIDLTSEIIGQISNSQEEPVEQLLISLHSSISQTKTPQKVHSAIQTFGIPQSGPYLDSQALSRAQTSLDLLVLMFEYSFGLQTQEVVELLTSKPFELQLLFESADEEPYQTHALSFYTLFINHSEQIVKLCGDDSTIISFIAQILTLGITNPSDIVAEYSSAALITFSESVLELDRTNEKFEQLEQLVAEQSRSDSVKLPVLSFSPHSAVLWQWFTGLDPNQPKVTKADLQNNNSFLSILLTQISLRPALAPSFATLLVSLSKLRMFTVFVRFSGLLFENRWEDFIWVNEAILAVVERVQRRNRLEGSESAFPPLVRAYLLSEVPSTLLKVVLKKTEEHTHKLVSTAIQSSLSLDLIPEKYESLFALSVPLLQRSISFLLRLWAVFPSLVEREPTTVSSIVSLLRFVSLLQNWQLTLTGIKSLVHLFHSLLHTKDPHLPLLFQFLVSFLACPTSTRSGSGFVDLTHTPLDAEKAFLHPPVFEHQLSLNHQLGLDSFSFTFDSLLRTTSLLLAANPTLPLLPFSTLLQRRLANRVCGTGDVDLSVLTLSRLPTLPPIHTNKLVSTLSSLLTDTHVAVTLAVTQFNQESGEGSEEEPLQIPHVPLATFRVLCLLFLQFVLSTRKRRETRKSVSAFVDGCFKIFLTNDDLCEQFEEKMSEEREGQGDEEREEEKESDETEAQNVEPAAEQDEPKEQAEDDNEPFQSPFITDGNLDRMEGTDVMVVEEGEGEEKKEEAETSGEGGEEVKEETEQKEGEAKVEEPKTETEEERATGEGEAEKDPQTQEGEEEQKTDGDEQKAKEEEKGDEDAAAQPDETEQNQERPSSQHTPESSPLSTKHTLSSPIHTDTPHHTPRHSNPGAQSPPDFDAEWHSYSHVGYLVDTIVLLGGWAEKERKGEKQNEFEMMTQQIGLVVVNSLVGMKTEWERVVSEEKTERGMEWSEGERERKKVVVNMMIDSLLSSIRKEMKIRTLKQVTLNPTRIVDNAKSELNDVFFPPLFSTGLGETKQAPNAFELSVLGFDEFSIESLFVAAGEKSTLLKSHLKTTQMSVGEEVEEEEEEEKGEQQPSEDGLRLFLQMKRGEEAMEGMDRRSVERRKEEKKREDQLVEQLKQIERAKAEAQAKKEREEANPLPPKPKDPIERAKWEILKVKREREEKQRQMEEEEKERKRQEMERKQNQRKRNEKMAEEFQQKEKERLKQKEEEEQRRAAEEEEIRKKEEELEAQWKQKLLKDKRRMEEAERVRQERRKMREAEDAQRKEEGKKESFRWLGEEEEGEEEREKEGRSEEKKEKRQIPRREPREGAESQIKAHQLQRELEKEEAEKKRKEIAKQRFDELMKRQQQNKIKLAEMEKKKKEEEAAKKAQEEEAKRKKEERERERKAKDDERRKTEKEKLEARKMELQEKEEEEKKRKEEEERRKKEEERVKQEQMKKKREAEKKKRDEELEKVRKEKEEEEAKERERKKKEQAQLRKKVKEREQERIEKKEKERQQAREKTRKPKEEKKEENKEEDTEQAVANTEEVKEEQS